MIHFSLGLPGRLAEWCEGAIAAIAGLGSVPFVTAQSGGETAIDDAALTAIRAGGSDVVMGARWPHRRLLQFLGGTRFVLALDDPRVAVATLMENHQAGVIHATRTVVGACPQLMEFAQLPGALKVNTADMRERAPQTLAAIAAHLGFAPLTEDSAEALASRLAQDSAAPEDWTLRIPPDGHKLVDGALGAYAACFDGGALGAMTWTRELFLSAGGDTCPVAPIDLRDTRNGRVLVYGPYLELPPGYWSAKIVLGLSPEASGQTLTIEAASGVVMATAQLLVRGSGGLYSTEVNFAIDELAVRPVEIRVMVGRDSTPGQLAFGHVQMRPVALHHAAVASREQGDFLEALAL